MRHLLFAPPFGLGHSALQRTGHLVGIKQHAPFNMAGGAANGLHQRSFRAQKTLLIGIQNGDQRTFGNIQPFAQQIDTDKNVKRAEPQIADDFNALQRVNIGMHIAHAQTLLMHIFGQILGHFLGQRGDQYAMAFARRLMAFGNQIINLRFGRTDFALRVNQPGRADNLFDKNAACALHFPRAGRRRHMHGLRAHHVPFLKLHWPVIDTAGQAEAKLRQG